MDVKNNFLFVTYMFTECVPDVSIESLPQSDDRLTNLSRNTQNNNLKCIFMIGTAINKTSRR